MEKTINEPGNKTEINIQGQYVKHLSFDSPSAPEVFTRLKAAPEIDLALDVQVQDKGEKKYEVTILLKVKAQKDVESVFTAELSYAGLFEVKDHATEEQKRQILLIYCPNLLFPFARSLLATVSREAGFQALMLNPVDFASLYLQQQKQGKVNSTAIH